MRLKTIEIHGTLRKVHIEKYVQCIQGNWSAHYRESVKKITTD